MLLKYLFVLAGGILCAEPQARHQLISQVWFFCEWRAGYDEETDIPTPALIQKTSL